MLDVAGPESVNIARLPRAAGGRYAEVLALTLAVPLFGYIARVPDPFFVRAPFPWLVLVAVLIGAQHGLLAALLAAGLSSVGAWAHVVATGGDTEGLRSWSVGCLFVALITGWSRDRAEAQRRQLGARARLAEAQLQRLSRTQRVLQLSHTGLEERLAGQGWSLENLVRQASRELGRATTQGRVYAVVLDVLGSQAPIQAASLFACRGSEGGRARGGDAQARGESRVRLEPVPAACLGKLDPGLGRSLLVQHPIIERVLATGQAALLAPERMGLELEDAILAALPLVTSAGRWLGVIAVHEMPFIAFSPETFSELLAIAECLADLVEVRLVELEGSLPAALPAPRANAELSSLLDRVAPARVAAARAVPARAVPAPVASPASASELENRTRRSRSGVHLKLEDTPSRSRGMVATVRRRGGQS